MGLESALVDRARIVRQEAASTQRVRGMTVTAPVAGPWVAVLLLMPSGATGRDEGHGRRRVVTQPTLMLDSYDENNEPVAITARDRIQVESERFGTATWEPVGDPEPLGSLYETIGYQVVVKRVVEHQLETIST